MPRYKASSETQRAHLLNCLCIYGHEQQEGGRAVHATHNKQLPFYR